MQLVFWKSIKHIVLLIFCVEKNYYQKHSGKFGIVLYSMYYVWDKIALDA